MRSWAIESDNGVVCAALVNGRRVVVAVSSRLVVNRVVALFE